MTGTYHIAANAFDAPSLVPGLYLVATPIGNLGDVTIRALETLSACDVIYCEDTRVTVRLLERYGIKKPMKPLHDHNEADLALKLVHDIEAGQSLCLVSDAGTPLISDPGYRLVKACAEAGVLLTSIPGASAVPTALQLSGLATDRFTFIGFLPQTSAARRQLLELLGSAQGTLVAYESPHRLRDAFAVMAVQQDDSTDGVRMLQEWLGHTNIGTTMRYRKVAGQELKEWYEKLWNKGKKGNG